LRFGISERAQAGQIEDFHPPQDRAWKKDLDELDTFAADTVQVGNRAQRGGSIDQVNLKMGRIAKTQKRGTGRVWDNIDGKKLRLEEKVNQRRLAGIRLAGDGNKRNEVSSIAAWSGQRLELPFPRRA
jgi:hypothetical protein